MDVSIDKFNGYHIYINNTYNDIDVNTYKRKYNSLWIDVQIPFRWLDIMSIIPKEFGIIPGRSGIIHDTKKNIFRFWLWLNDSVSPISPGATHNIRAAALIIDPEEYKICLVKPRNATQLRLPGGHYEISDISPMTTSLREAQEELQFDPALSTAYEGEILGIIELPNDRFVPTINIIYGYSIPGVSKRKYTINTKEITEGGWYSFGEDIEGDPDISVYHVLNTYLEDKGFKLKDSRGWLNGFY